MGMIPGTFIVKDDLSSVSSEEIKQEIAATPIASGGTCGGSTGGCGCGA